MAVFKGEVVGPAYTGVEEAEAVFAGLDLVVGPRHTVDVDNVAVEAWIIGIRLRLILSSREWTRSYSTIPRLHEALHVHPRFPSQ